MCHGNILCCSSRGCDDEAMVDVVLERRGEEYQEAKRGMRWDDDRPQPPTGARFDD